MIGFIAVLQEGPVLIFNFNSMIHWLFTLNTFGILDYCDVWTFFHSRLEFGICSCLAVFVMLNFHVSLTLCDVMTSCDVTLWHYLKPLFAVFMCHLTITCLRSWWFLFALEVGGSCLLVFSGLSPCLSFKLLRICVI